MTTTNELILFSASWKRIPTVPKFRSELFTSSLGLPHHVLTCTSAHIFKEKVGRNERTESYIAIISHFYSTLLIPALLFFRQTSCHIKTLHYLQQQFSPSALLASVIMNLSLCLSILVAACSVQSFSPSLLSSRRSSFSFAQSTIFSTSTTTHLRLSDSNVDVLEKQSSNSSASQVSPIEDASSSLTTLVVQGDTPELLVQTEEEEKSDAEYQKGILTIGFICLLNASLAPIWHTVFASGNDPPPLFLNAVVSVVALIGLLSGGPLLDSSVESSSALAESNSEEKWSWNSFRGGMELGFWKGLGVYDETVVVAVILCLLGNFSFSKPSLLFLFCRDHLSYLWNGLDDGQSWRLFVATDHLDCPRHSGHSRRENPSTNSTGRRLGVGRHCRLYPRSNR